MRNEAVLLSGGYDHRVNIVDVRQSEGSGGRVNLSKSDLDIECAYWHPKAEYNFALSTESGMVYGYDTRQLQEPLFTIKAHEKACSSLSFSPHISNMMATASTDEYVKVWDISTPQPKLVSYKKMATVKLYFS